MKHLKTYQELNEEMSLVTFGTGYILSIIGLLTAESILKSIGGAIWRRVKLGKEGLHKGLDKIKKKALEKAETSEDRVKILEESKNIREKINSGDIKTLGDIYKELEK